MRRAFVPFSLVLSLATAFVLAELRLAFLAPLDADGASAPTSANAATVRRFYDAVNRVLLTGDSTPLDDLLDESFVEHTARPGQTSDRMGLVHYLGVLHLTAPLLSLTSEDVIAQGDRVSAIVRVEGWSGQPAAGLPAIAGRPWSTIDVFRLRSGRVAEHWGEGTALGIVEPLLTFDVPVEEEAAKWVEVARLTYPPRGADRHWAGGPAILIVESGTLTVTPDPSAITPATVIPAAAARRSLAPGRMVVLGAGDVVVLGSRTDYETRNNDATPAALLVLWSGDPPYPIRTSSAPAGPDARSDATAVGSNYVSLVGGVLVTLPDRWATVTIGRFMLASGATLAHHEVARAEFAVVESGSLALTAENGTAWVRLRPDEPARAATGSPVGSGAGLSFDAGTTVAIAPTGDTPLIVLVISIGSEGDGDPSTPSEGI